MSTKAQWDSFKSPATGSQMLRIVGRKGYSATMYCPADWSMHDFARAVRMLAAGYVEYLGRERKLDELTRFARDGQESRRA